MDTFRRRTRAVLPGQPDPGGGCVPGGLLALLPLFDPLVLVAGGIRHRCPVAPPGHPPNPLRSEDGRGWVVGTRHLGRRRHPSLRPAAGAGARPGVAPAALRPHPHHPAAPWGTGLPADPGQRLGPAGQRPGHQPHPLGPHAVLSRRKQGLQPGHRREPGGQPPERQVWAGPSSSRQPL